MQVMIGKVSLKQSDVMGIIIESMYAYIINK